MKTVVTIAALLLVFFASFFAVWAFVLPRVTFRRPEPTPAPVALLVEETDFSDGVVCAYPLFLLEEHGDLNGGDL